jgi:competence CoiA-like predicted nuclease
MLCAKRKLTGEIVTAYFAEKTHGPFKCPDCGDEVILKTGMRIATALKVRLSDLVHGV